MLGEHHQVMHHLLWGSEYMRIEALQNKTRMGTQSNSVSVVNMAIT